MGVWRVREYLKGGLDNNDLTTNPLELFARGMQDAIDMGLPDANAMTVATVGRDGQPSQRIVLLKGIDDKGFTFFTNYDSRKGDELAENPCAAALLYWKEFERQVRIEGTVTKASESDSDSYFAARPRESCIGAWASLQSQPLASREVLEQRTAEVETRFAGGPVPRPPNWGGYWLQPESFEFWQGGAARLHDRLIYRRQADGRWQIERLFP